MATSSVIIALWIMSGIYTQRWWIYSPPKRMRDVRISARSSFQSGSLRETHSINHS